MTTAALLPLNGEQGGWIRGTFCTNGLFVAFDQDMAGMGVIGHFDIHGIPNERQRDDGPTTIDVGFGVELDLLVVDQGLFVTDVDLDLFAVVDGANGLALVVPLHGSAGML